MTTTTMVHGNQKAVVTKESTEIYDLDKQEIIHIDTVKKQYSVDTLDDMRKLMAQCQGKMQQAQAPARRSRSNRRRHPATCNSAFQCR